MCARRKAALQRAAADYLDSINAPRGPFVAAVTDVEGVEHRLPCQVWPESLPPAEPSAASGGGRKFSPLEKKILDGLKGAGWMTAADLAEAIGEPLNHDFRAILRNLGEADHVVTNQRFGVRLATPEAETG